MHFANMYFNVAISGGPQLVEASGGLEAIDELHYGPVDPAISSEAAILVDRFFGDDYESGENIHFYSSHFFAI